MCNEDGGFQEEDPSPIRNVHSVQVIKEALTEFAAMSGLQVNPMKSQIILSRSVQSQRQQIIDLIRFQEGNLPIKFGGYFRRTNTPFGWLGCCYIDSKIRLLWTAKVSNATWCWKKLVKLSSLIKPGLVYRVGDDNKFKLWLDLWHERGPFITSFPTGPSITGLPSDTLLQEVLQQGQWAWPSETDFDINEIISSLPTTNPGESDSILWNTNSGQFSTVAAMALLQPSTSYVQWHSLLEGKFKILRHNFILWLAIKERLSTMDRPWIGQQGDDCVLCDSNSTESHSHLFFHCAYSRRALTEIKRSVRFHWPGFDWQTAVLWASRRWRGSHLLNAASRSMLASLVYHLWLECNNKRFKATTSAAESLALRAIEDVRLRIISANIKPSLQVAV
ncbi:UNVERIFIED_CONTAM: hypothetical protein Slati_2214900 [Sesamum latifolium]|uniref:Reverse transcriptase zinc-binding domain-containing protein n=1 Tax=Sesamum latifolium TaxID=2727402 RepID=A0AAW2WT72_9LAMI